MGKIKIKNQTEARMAKISEVFGIDGEYIDYIVDDSVIVLPNGIEAFFVKTVKDIEGYDILKDITIEVTLKKDSEDLKEFTLNWQQDHGIMWIVHACVNKLIATPRASGSGLSKENKLKLAEERKRFLAAKNIAKPKKVGNVKDEVKNLKAGK